MEGRYVNMKTDEHIVWIAWQVAQEALADRDLDRARRIEVNKAGLWWFGRHSRNPLISILLTAQNTASVEALTRALLKDYVKRGAAILKVRGMRQRPMDEIIDNLIEDAPWQLPPPSVVSGGLPSLGKRR